MTLVVVLSLSAATFAWAASVKPLDIVSEKIFANEAERLASEHSDVMSMLRRTVERLNRQVDISSVESGEKSLQAFGSVAAALGKAEKSANSLVDYLTKNRITLISSGNERYFPLTDLVKDIERPYFKAVSSFAGSGSDFIRYCTDNFNAISAGSENELKRYEELYGGYLREVESFNEASQKRSRLIADMSEKYPAVWELLPR